MKKKAIKRPKRKEKTDNQNRKKTYEIVGIGLFLLSLITLISVAGFHPADPSWTHSTSPEIKAHNFMGKVGAVLADLIFQLFGFTAYLFPVLLGFYGFLAIKKETGKRIFFQVTIPLFLFFYICAFLSVLAPEISFKGTHIRSGGLFGLMISQFLIKYFNHFGTVVLLAGIFFVIVILTTHISPKKLFHFLSGLFRFAFKEVRIGVTRPLKEKAESKKKEPRPAKEKTETKKRPEKTEPKLKPSIDLPRDKQQRPEPPSPPPPEKFLFPEMAKTAGYRYPPLNLLDAGQPAEKIDKDELYDKKCRIEEKLQEFRIEGEVREYHPGPVITTYEYYPQPGVKVSQIANMTEDLSLALGAEAVRIHRMPGKSSLGVEVPNNKREIIKVRDIIQSEKFANNHSKLTIALGKTIHGEVYVTDLTVMPHLLIAGATGTGKSVALNVLITSLLYKASPDEVKLILIDPKRLEFSLYDGVPHLLSPVIKDPKKAGSVLMDAIKKMEERYHKLGFLKVRNIEQYNKEVHRLRKEKKGILTDEEKENLKILPYIVIIIDELSELMMVGAQDVEYCIARLAQLARAVGIHLVMATQRPSIDVITGTIKNNFSSRIAFRVPSKVDSRIIIDTSGAEKLLGLGDMLFLPPNYPRLIRLHCSCISIAEVTRLVRFVKEQGSPSYDEKIIKVLKKTSDQVWDEEQEEKDDLYDKAVELILLTGQASASYLQRKLKLGYARAARIIDQMEQEGIVGPSEGSKPREILVDAHTHLHKDKEDQ
ncbi:MAG: DNA translocase FtsK [Candidatus Aminicenantes bacterium]|nr:DNA translocase FtsK [Candidatus Aminicenantes bacterium]